MADRAAITTADLRHIGLFGAMSDDVLGFLAGMLRVIEPGIGETIFKEGDDANAMYVVLAGEMEVTKRSRAGVDARVACSAPAIGSGAAIVASSRRPLVRAIAPVADAAHPDAALDRYLKMSGLRLSCSTSRARGAGAARRRPILADMLGT